MTRIALLASEPIRRRMAGIGIRYLEFARRLSCHGIETVLISPAAPAETAELELTGVELRRFERARLPELVAGCQGAVAQGQLANDLLLAVPELPVAIDLYDPWLVENLSYAASLGLDPFRNDHATWLLQMSRGDFFLCSSEEQRLFYLGFLTAAGRVNPELAARDPDLRTLIDAVPFGVPDELAPHQPYLPPRAVGEVRLLFGGLYDWYDPWTLLAALEGLAARGFPSWRLLLIRNPNPESTPQRLFSEVEKRCKKLGWWGSRVLALDWVPAERRYDLMRDVDLLVAPHRPSLESGLALRTRLLDALAAGCPVVASAGGTMSRLLREHRAGWVVPPGDAAALGEALSEALGEARLRVPGQAEGERSDEAPGGAAGPQAVAAAVRQAGARRLLESFRWPRALAPLLAFCRAPWRDAGKGRFAASLVSAAPPDRLALRLRRRLRHLLGSGGAE
ncbi:MAG TPA: glycosyltransferase [Thermoanaerobaculia bacterium]|nr:glycosyltransferase [Thermoanaerobaculia bacterium]